MDIRKLEFFVATVEEKSFRAAARRLYTSQPPLSAAVRQLEEELGVLLLERTPSGVLLTDAGAEMYGYAKEILGRIEDTRLSMRRHRSGEELRVGAVSGIIGAAELTGVIIDAFQTLHSDIRVSMHDISFVDMIEPLIEGRVDVALLREPVKDPRIRSVAIATEPRRLMVGMKSDLVGETSMRSDDLRGMGALGVSGPAWWSKYWSASEDAGTRQTADSMDASTIPEVQFSVYSNDLIVTVASALERFAPSPLVKYLNIEDLPANQISVACRLNDRRPTVEKFIEVAANTSAANYRLIPGGGPP